MNWIDVKERLPQQNKKYPVVIEDDIGRTWVGLCSFHLKRKLFHFDMHHIQWKVIKWFDLPKH